MLGLIIHLLRMKVTKRIELLMKFSFLEIGLQSTGLVAMVTNVLSTFRMESAFASEMRRVRRL